jgi:hypothetical protein
MAKRNEPAGEADDSQNELDFEQSGNGDGTIDAPADAGASSGGEWPRLDKRQGLNESSEPAQDIPVMTLTSLELSSAWNSTEDMPPGAGAGMRSYRLRRIAALAAAVALSAALGAVAGSMITTGLGSTMAAGGKAEASTQIVLKRMEQEVSALRTAVETAARDAERKTARITDRLERSQKAQAEPLAKLAKIGEAVERLERRTAAAKVAATKTANAGDVTGSIGTSRVATPVPKPANIISGWTLHDVYDGVALIKGRAGLIEVWPGDTLPQIGRIEAIRKQDGHWVVVTSRGIIRDR